MPDRAPSLESAQTLLRQFTCRELDATLPDLDLPKDAVQQALLTVTQHSDNQIFGICADSVEQAQAALSSYLRAIGEDVPEIPARSGTVYVKYNPATRRCYSDAYTGDHRGVLVSCQSAFDDGVNETFGHLPLDLFRE